MHIADEEGDPYAVDLAGRLGAYVVGNDSDFVVLNTEGYQGYIPMDELLWSWTLPAPDDEQPQSVDAGDDGFQPVRKGKKKPAPAAVDVRQRTGLGLLPMDLELDLDRLPESLPTNLTLALSVYRPAAFAAHLNLSPSLLPLVGALAGNDYTQTGVSGTSRQSFTHLFFPHDLTLAQRIDLVASTLRSILSASSASSKRKVKPVASVMDLIDAAITKLLLRDPSTLGSGERERIIDKIVDATLQYAIPPREDGVPALNVSSACTIHEPSVCPLVDMLSQGGDEVDVCTREIRRRYLAAYRAGNLSPHILDAVSTGTAWPRLFLENPNMESTARSVGRPIREWIYAILEDALGLPDSSENVSTVDDDDDDELVDVVEDQTDSEAEKVEEKIMLDRVDPLSELELKLQRLQLEQRARNEDGIISTANTRPASSAAYLSMSSSFLTSAPSIRTSASRRGNKVVKEHVRRATRLAEEDVVVPSLPSLIARHPDSEESDTAKDVSLLIQDDDARLELFLRILDSDFPELRALPRDQLMAVVTVRHVVRRLQMRAQQSGSHKDREKERWTQSEVRAFLAAFDWATVGAPTVTVGSDVRTRAEGGRLTQSGLKADEMEPALVVIPVEDRNVQLTAQVSTTMEAVEHLSQVLFLTERVPSPAHLFSGRRFHMWLTSRSMDHTPVGNESANVSRMAFEACMIRMEEAFSHETWKKSRKEKKKAAAEDTSIAKSSKFPVVRQRSAQGSSMYSLLAGLEVE